MVGTRSSRRGESPPRKPLTLRLRMLQSKSQIMDADEASQQVPAVTEGDVSTTIGNRLPSVGLTNLVCIEAARPRNQLS